MAVANNKSTVITNADATPPTINSSYLARGAVYEAVGIATVAAADDDNSVYRIARVPSNARVTSLKLNNAAITGSSAWIAGFYDTAAVNSGAIIGSGNQLMTTKDISAGLTVPTECLTVTAANSEKRVWELLGLSSDPNKQYDICLTANTVGSAAGTVGCRIQYVV